MFRTLINKTMKKVTIIEKDKNVEIDSYETYKIDQEYQNELNEFRGKIARELLIPFRFQEVKVKILSILVFLCAQGMFSCLPMTTHKSDIQSDSSVARSSELSEKWNREVIREYLPGHDTIHSIHQVNVPYPVPGKTIYRETIRDQGERKENNFEEIKAILSQKETDKEFPKWLPWIILAMFGMIILSFFLAVFKIFKS